MTIIEPFDCSKEQRRQFHTLLDQLTKVLGEKAEQPRSRPALRLLPPSGPGVITQSPERPGENKGRIMTPFEILRALDKAAEALTHRHIGEWSCYVCSILESLQEEAEPDEYEAFLTELQADVTARLLAGKW